MVVSKSHAQSTFAYHLMKKKRIPSNVKEVREDEGR
jgi:hypothetical protein